MGVYAPLFIMPSLRLEDHGNKQGLHIWRACQQQRETLHVRQLHSSCSTCTLQSLLEVFPLCLLDSFLLFHFTLVPGVLIFIYASCLSFSLVVSRGKLSSNTQQVTAII